MALTLSSAGKSEQLYLFDTGEGLAFEPKLNSPLPFCVCIDTPFPGTLSTLHYHKELRYWSLNEVSLIGLIPGGPIKIDFRNMALSGTAERHRAGKEKPAQFEQLLQQVNKSIPAVPSSCCNPS